MNELVIDNRERCEWCDIIWISQDDEKRSTELLNAHCYEVIDLRHRNSDLNEQLDYAVQVLRDRGVDFWGLEYINKRTHRNDD